MKTRYFLTGLFILSLIAFAIPVQAQDYNIGVAEGNEAVFEVRTLDKDAIEDYVGDDKALDFLIDDDAEVGAKAKYKITKIEEDGDDWKVSYDSWDWTTEEFAADPDDSEDTTVRGDPTELSTPPTIAGTDVATYLDNIDWADNYEAEGTTVTYTWKKEELEQGYPDVEGDILWIFTYDSNGFQSGQQLTDEDGNVFFEYGVSAIPGYELPILLGVTAIGAIGLIYTMMKKK